MVFEKLQKLLSEQLDVEVGKITMEANIMDDLGADSLDVVEMVMSLEEEFEIEVPDGDAENLKTVGDVVRYIEDRQ